MTCSQCAPDPNSVLLIIMPSRKIQMQRLPSPPVIGESLAKTYDSKNMTLMTLKTLKLN